MNLPDIAGYVASALLLATFSVRTMIPLRLLGISSSVAFLTYGFFSGLLPIIILHLILLPLNLYRFFEMRRLTREMQAAAKDANGFAALQPFTSAVSLPAGTMLFHRGDAATDMYVLTSGRVRLPELGVDIGPGGLIGEVGMFSPSGRRMTTAVCGEATQAACMPARLTS